jgi:hypothetical protein
MRRFNVLRSKENHRGVPIASYGGMARFLRLGVFYSTLMLVLVQLAGG